ncbi:MAG: IS30 family transposase [Candidatus Aureabacteria bacterium]|nr:IS30 family transposase [Candidatus Auribacterota bacterium]
MKNKLYKHISSDERDKIAYLRASGKSLSAIARAIGRNKATVSREIKRNRSSKYDVYLANRAHQRAIKRKQLSVQRQRIRNPLIRQYLMKKIKLKWSPELIAGRLPLDHPGLHISHEAIYQYIYDCSTRKEHDLVPYLTRAHKRRRLRTHSHRHKTLHIPQRISIKERPQEVETRNQPGHWEADTLISRKSKAALAVALERTSRLVRLAKLPAKTSRDFKNALTRRLSRFPRHLMLSITYDNGCENVEHAYTNKVLGTKSYFCEPFHSWEKASIENAIGIIRRFFPKKTDFASITKQHVKRVETLLNTRPKKCLNYLTPNEILGLCVALRS